METDGNPEPGKHGKAPTTIDQDRRPCRPGEESRGRERRGGHAAPLFAPSTHSNDLGVTHPASMPSTSHEGAFPYALLAPSRRDPTF